MKSIVTKYIKLILLFSLASSNLKGQQQPLYIFTDNMYNLDSISSNLFHAGLNKKVKELLSELNLSDQFTAIVTDSKNASPGNNFIKLYSSYNYLTHDQTETVIPKFIVHKENWQTPYYYSYFIARKEPSDFNSFSDFGNIKTIYLQSNSISGYYSPLYKFWEMGLIKNPSVKSLKDELQKEVFVYNSADSVINAVSQTNNSIGATGKETYGSLKVEIKLVNMVLPQDVICISKTLTQYEEKLTNLIYRLFTDPSTIKKLHLHITNVTPFLQTYQNSYNFNRSIIKLVDATKERYDKDVYLSKVIPLNDKISAKDLWAFIGKSSISVYIWIFGVLLAVYTLGHNTGNIFLPVFDKFKGKLKGLFDFKAHTS